MQLRAKCRSKRATVRTHNGNLESAYKFLVFAIAILHYYSRNRTTLGLVKYYSIFYVFWSLNMQHPYGVSESHYYNTMTTTEICWQHRRVSCYESCSFFSSSVNTFVLISSTSSSTLLKKNIHSQVNSESHDHCN